VLIHYLQAELLMMILILSFWFSQLMNANWRLYEREALMAQ